MVRAQLGLGLEPGNGIFPFFFLVCVKMWQKDFVLAQCNNSTIVIMLSWCNLGNGDMENQPKWGYFWEFGWACKLAIPIRCQNASRDSCKFQYSLMQLDEVNIEGLSLCGVVRWARMHVTVDYILIDKDWLGQLECPSLKCSMPLSQNVFPSWMFVSANGIPWEPPAWLRDSEVVTLRDLIREAVKEVLCTQPSNPKPADNPESGEWA